MLFLSNSWIDLEYFEHFFNSNTLNELVAGIGAIIAIPIIYYLLETFLGYRLFKVKCLITGFAAGFTLGLFLGKQFSFPEPWQVYALSAVLGVLAGFSAFKFYKFGVFFTSAISGFTLGLSLGGVLGLNLGGVLLVALILAIVVGLVAVFLTKICIILTTAYSGGMGLAGCVLVLAGLGTEWVPLAGLVLCVLGAVVQFATTKKA